MHFTSLQTKIFLIILQKKTLYIYYIFVRSYSEKSFKNVHLRTLIVTEFKIIFKNDENDFTLTNLYYKTLFETKIMFIFVRNRPYFS